MMSFQKKFSFSVLLLATLTIISSNSGAYVFVQGAVHDNGDDTQHIRDEIDNCKDLVKEGKCRTDPHEMYSNCRYSCSKWAEENTKKDVAYIKDGDESFFELSAKNSTGSVINFDRFEGYVTIVINVVKICLQDSVEQGYQIFESLQRVWPYTVEILVFTFEHPDFDYSKIEDCKAHEEAFKKKGRHIHVMEQVNINGPKTHPVYKYLKGLFHMDELDNNYSTFFLVTPDGDSIEVHLGSSEEQLKAAIRMHLDRDL
mmetsp:Transcript_959/g.1352  ORF Transcript_959/g.1352 Transcript_959/m.1352 type:complete len:257 (+) Transcript_959:140-910(+)